MQRETDSSNVKMKILLGVLLVAAVAACVFAFTSKKPREDLETEVVLICTNPQCGEQTAVTLGELRKLKSRLPRGNVRPPEIECPKCHQLSAYRARKCPKCGEYYVPWPDADGTVRCPHCNVDVRAYRRSQR